RAAPLPKRRFASWWILPVVICTLALTFSCANPVDRGCAVPSRALLDVRLPPPEKARSHATPALKGCQRRKKGHPKAPSFIRASRGLAAAARGCGGGCRRLGRRHLGRRRGRNFGEHRFCSLCLPDIVISESGACRNQPADDH